MRASISAPFVDTSADDLVWTLDHPLVAPLATRTVRVPGARVELRVLGASHQVVVAPESEHGSLVETVACLPGLPGGLPGGVERSDLGRYRFDSLVEPLPRTALALRVERLHREVADSPRGLLVAFPGDPLAVTALRLVPDREDPLRWRTWHAYPQSGELVTTTSTVTMPPTSERTAQ
ncbi:hypothetical protein A6A08_00285 [Nocardiopsis sp. TSRI0078]|uniref:DUF2617 family protein n=1 Tax=unclassified Nocardiopsis TaxID=2649073 RepID=UPI00093C08E4|nr:DUF2617 family protein [Nocardiopsis sp. TSRI0078]OKI23285.1 hypothetical protein A6A08_00285 [Nocardiopsis sp. TSRI0078]